MARTLQRCIRQAAGAEVEAAPVRHSGLQRRGVRVLLAAAVKGGCWARARALCLRLAKLLQQARAGPQLL